MKRHNPAPYTHPWLIRPLLFASILLIAVVSPPSYAQTEIPLDRLLTELQRTLVRVRDALADSDLPPFTSALLRVSSTLKRTRGGELALFVAQIDSDVKETSILEVQIELQPPRNSDSVPVSSTSDVLADAIIRASHTIKLAQRGSPPLRPRKLTAAVSFAASSSVGGGSDIRFEFLGIDVGATARASSGRKQTHHIAITFDYGP